MHSSTESLLSFFNSSHLPPKLQSVVFPFESLANEIAVTNEKYPSDAPAEVTTALRKLLEAKDCAVRAALSQDLPTG